MNSTATIAKTIRADLKAAFPGIKFSVRTSTYSMGSSITVELKEAPAGGITSREYMAAELARPSQHSGLSRWTVEANELQVAVEKVAGRLHWDRSDSQTDYSNCNFHLHVGFDSAVEHADYEATKAAVTADMMKAVATTPAPAPVRLARVYTLVTPEVQAAARADLANARAGQAQVRYLALMGL